MSLRKQKHALFLLTFIFVALHTYAQECKRAIAIRATHSPKMDGSLNDSVWMNVPISENFIQLKPYPGVPSKEKTEIKVIYDDDAVYIGAMMFDDKPDSILRQLGVRDEYDGGNTDLFTVSLGPYNDNQHAFVFSVSAAGVQSDIKVANDDYDVDWNAVWQSEVKMLSNGWSVELKIPYSAIRFPKTEIQTWQVNFARHIRRYREQSFWNPIDPKKNGFVNQCGQMTGIEKINSPLRLSLVPYVSAYAENYPYNIPGKSNTTYLFNGGMDLKYGMSESFTLDMTLVPDFGQVQSDNHILNLTPFEVFYNEKRSFFTEGTDLFAKADLFYSRRVGGLPIGYNAPYNSLNVNEIVQDNPTQSHLYNATKISGRTKGGLGIGFFNATSAETFATIRDTITGGTRKVMTAPLTNYNVTVFDQTFGKNSNISFINTNVMRDGAFADANITGTQFKIANKKNSYAIQAYGAVAELPKKDSTQNSPAYKYLINFGKTSGNYQVALVHMEVSDKFDQNDLGYKDRNNEFNFYLPQSFNTYEPFWIINKMSNDLSIRYMMLYAPRVYREFNIDLNSDIDFKNYFTLGTFFSTNPVKKNYDYYGPHVIGRYYVFASSYGGGNYFSTDYRKKLALDGSWNLFKVNERNRRGAEYSLGPRYRFSDHLTVRFDFDDAIHKDDVGFVDQVNDTIIYGVRNVNTITNELNATYTFTNRMSLSFRARHYWSKVKYNSYFALADNGTAGHTNYVTPSDIDFNAFNIDMVYTWQFAPGSEMSIVWKNAIYKQESVLAKKYFDSLNKTLDSPQNNSFSIKLLYYLDYQTVKRTFSKRSK